MSAKVRKSATKGRSAKDQDPKATQHIRGVWSIGALRGHAANHVVVSTCPDCGAPVAA